MSMQPGPELDRLIAEKVMGLAWGKIAVPAGMDALENWIEEHELEGPITKPGSVFPRSYWSPSRDISHAWEVVEHITKPGGVRNSKTGFLASSHFSFAFKASDMWAESASDAAYQICLMALKAVGIDV